MRVAKNGLLFFVHAQPHDGSNPTGGSVDALVTNVLLAAAPVTMAKTAATSICSSIAFVA